MEANLHTINNLFAQLGLPSDADAISAFIESHRPIGQNLAVSEASFWTPSQAKFLRQQILQDADWAIVVDELSTRLR